ncbi:hypothetical protein BJ878DRAFT_509393 [Calycina marina]|uniref:ABM domain-containing protein n=1 Tax=Calycina marina TaxID=1763456 RepID=A0A9P7Z1A1_9HELO|nr:hypothetical protein BJ878DRAFT_509393 [Calycina marina]
MPSRYVIAQLRTAGGAHRQTVIDSLTRVSQYSAAQEAGVLKFCVAIPRPGTSDDKTSVFAIEEYADQAGFDAHMASQAVADLTKVFSADPTIWSGAPEIYGLEQKLEPRIQFVKSKTGQVEDPYIVFATLGFAQGKTGKGVQKFKEMVVTVEKEEEGTLAYTVLEDEAGKCVRTVEVYEGKQSVESVEEKHGKLGGGDKAEGRTKKDEIWKLQMVAGYLWKEEKPRL